MTDKVAPEFIFTQLRNRFGIPSPPERKHPLDELILTILSQNTNDRNRDRAFNALKARCPGFKDLLELPLAELIEIIAPAGLGPTKGRRIHALLRHINKSGQAEFPDLCAMEPAKSMEYLTGFDGVGPKTASCVLLFSCGIPVFPVDTHIYRIGGRLGLLPAGTDREKAHDVMGALFRPEQYLELHLNLIRLGRELCRPKKPECGRCPLEQRCPTSKTGKGGNDGRG